MLIVIDQKGGSLLTRTPSGSRLHLKAGVPVEVSDKDGAALIAANPSITEYVEPAEAPQDGPDGPAEAEADSESTSDTDGPAEAAGEADEKPKPKRKVRAKPKPKPKPKPASSGAISVADLTEGGRVQREG